MKFLVTGASGMLGQAVCAVLRGQGSECIALDRTSLDVTNAEAVAETLALHRPTIVIQCAAYTRVDDAEREEAHAHEVNAAGTANVAAACRAIGARLVYPSTDYVFDGAARAPYPPDAEPHPLNAYGRSKLAGEKAARAAGDCLVVRTAWLYGPGGRNFVRTVIDRIRAHQALRVVDDQHGAPSWAGDVARTFVKLATDAPAGTYHAANRGVTTWYDVARAIAAILGEPAEITPCKSAEYSTPARRPAYSVLDCRTTEALTGVARPWDLALRDAIEKEHY